MKSRLAMVDFKKIPHKKIYNEEGRIVGTLCNGIYMGTLAIFNNFDSVVFTLKEWDQVKNAELIEYCSKGMELHYDIAGEVARDPKVGRIRNTPQGLRYCVPLSYWTARQVGLYK